jgi:hypothetical protein
MGLFEKESLSSKGQKCGDNNDDDNAVTTRNSNKTYNGKDRANTGTKEENGQKLEPTRDGDGRSWIRDDCLEFYRNKLLLPISSDSSSYNSKL